MKIIKQSLKLEEHIDESENYKDINDRQIQLIEISFTLNTNKFDMIEKENKENLKDYKTNLKCEK